MYLWDQFFNFFSSTFLSWLLDHLILILSCMRKFSVLLYVSQLLLSLCFSRTHILSHMSWFPLYDVDTFLSHQYAFLKSSSISHICELSFPLLFLIFFSILISAYLKTFHGVFPRFVPRSNLNISTSSPSFHFLTSSVLIFSVILRFRKHFSLSNKGIYELTGKNSVLYSSMFFFNFLPCVRCAQRDPFADLQLSLSGVWSFNLD